LNKQCQAFAWIVRLGQNRVPHTHGYWTLDTVVMITESGISTSTRKWHKYKSCEAWWADRTSWIQWDTALSNVGRTIRSSLRSIEMLCRQMMVKINDNY
jgi:hypothetical protein